MKKDMLFETIRKIIANGFGFRDSEVTMNSCFLEDLGSDGLMFFILSYAIKEKLNISFSDDDFYSVFYDDNGNVRRDATVGDLCDFIKDAKKYSSRAY